MSFTKAYLKKDTVQDVLNAGPVELLHFCHSNECTPRLFEALFRDNFPELVDLIELNDKTCKMINDYRPKLVNNHGVNVFWEMLYFELISLNNIERDALEKHLNGTGTSKHDYLMKYPALTVFLAQKIKSIHNKIIIHDKIEYAEYITLNKNDLKIAIKSRAICMIQKMLELNLWYQGDLTDAVKNGPDVIRVFLKYSDMDQDNLKIGLFFAIKIGYPEVKAFLDYTEFNYDSVFLLNSIKKPLILELLLSYFNREPINSYILIQAIKTDSLDSVRVLLEDGRVNPDNHFILSLYNKNPVSTLQVFLEDGRVDEHLYVTTLNKAIDINNIDVVRFLIEDSHIVFSYLDIENAFQDAIAPERIEIIRILLKNIQFPQEILNLGFRMSLYGRQFRMMKVILAEVPFSQVSDIKAMFMNDKEFFSMYPEVSKEILQIIKEKRAR